LKATYSNQSGAGLKFRRLDFAGPGSQLELRGSVGLHFRQRYEASIKQFDFFTEHIKADVLAGYWLMPDESFFGIGLHTNVADETNYRHEFAYGQFALSAPLGETFSVSTSLSYDYNNILSGKDPDLPSTTEAYSPADLPGLETNIQLWGVQLFANYDSKRIRGEKILGHQLLVGGGIYNELGGQTYEFWKMRADLRTYRHLFYGRNLILRLACEVTEPFADRTVPFFRLAEIGSRETVRGFERGRFYDQDMLLGSVEYQYPIWRNYLQQSTVDALLFFDFGHVAEDIRYIRNKNTRIGAGFGIRLWNKNGEWARIMISKSKERWRFYFVLN
jgi:outer membrane protein assembly factor BamA